jgi:LemA protein
MVLLLLLILVGGVAYLVRLYNGLQKASERVREAHANIVVSMKKRIDLANKLIDIAKSYGDHEKLTHIAVSQADSGGDAAVIAAPIVSFGVLTDVPAARSLPALLT